jgi:hypothetical protein
MGFQPLAAGERLAHGKARTLSPVYFDERVSGFLKVDEDDG